MDELIYAVEKHKKSAIAMEEMAESMKKKVVDYRIKGIKMMDELYNLEYVSKEI